MRILTGAALAIAALLAAPAYSARAQMLGSESPLAPDATIYSGTTEFHPPTPSFFSPYLGGQSQGYGYYPSMYWSAAGGPLYFKMYTDGSVSSPYRTGSTVFLPNLGYTAWGDGPYLIPLRPLPYPPYKHFYGY